MLSSSEICPRSLLRYRPIGADVAPDVSPWIQTTQRRSSQPTAQPPRTIARKTEAPILSAQSSGSLATVVGLGMCLMLMLIVGAQSFVGWAQTTLDDWQYGRPRTFQTDAFVGQEQAGQPSHFVAINKH